MIGTCSKPPRRHPLKADIHRYFHSWGPPPVFSEGPGVTYLDKPLGPPHFQRCDCNGTREHETKSHVSRSGFIISQPKAPLHYSYSFGLQTPQSP